MDNSLEEIRKSLVPSVVSQVDISWGSCIELKSPSKEIPALAAWCEVNIPKFIGYKIEPMEGS